MYCIHAKLTTLNWIWKRYWWSITIWHPYWIFDRPKITRFY